MKKGIISIGAVIFVLCVGLTQLLVKKEVTRWGEKQAELTSNTIRTYVDGELKNVETAAYTLACDLFSCAYRKDDGKSAVIHDFQQKGLPSEEEIFSRLEKFLDANPPICGVAIGFEKDVEGFDDGPYGTACYVTDINGIPKRLRLGHINDFRSKEWYRNAGVSEGGNWSLPFRESSENRVVTCFGFPIREAGSGKKLGVMAFDINTERFREQCDKAAPFPEAEISIVDRKLNFVSQRDNSLLLKSIADSEEFAEVFSAYNAEKQELPMYTVNSGDSIYYLTPIPVNGWTICTMFPEKALFASIDRMMKLITLISLVGILLMALFLFWIFKKVQKMTIRKAGLESELAIASGIQSGMLQKDCPADSATGFKLDVKAFLQPAKDVGGDLYDYQVRDGKLFFCVGDVSGKGVPASLFMAETLALFRSAVERLDSPSEIISAMNDTLSFNNGNNLFCTVFVGVIDLNAGILRFCNAGHNFPVIGGQFVKTKPELALGIMESIPYTCHETPFGAGQFLLTYSDGVTEAENLAKDLFGDDRLTDVTSGLSPDCSSEEIIDKVKNAVISFRGDAYQNDDITLMAIRYEKA